MMTLTDVAKYVWDNSKIIEFGGTPNWDIDTFTSKWIDKNTNGDIKRLNKASGFYWFSITNMDETDFKKILTPNNFPKNGIRFSERANEVTRIFTHNIYKQNENELVFYNGHESSVFNRIRSHFSLNNDKTGALGIGKYKLSQYKFKVKIFHCYFDMDDLSKEDSEYIKGLIKEKSGREAIESAWRVLYGWPILCKR